MKERFLLVLVLLRRSTDINMKGAVISIRNVLLANRKFVQEILDEVIIGLI